jgi:hypothetical protein
MTTCDSRRIQLQDQGTILTNGRFAPEAAVRYPSNDWVKKTCAKREMLVDRRAPDRQVEMRQACLPVGQVAPVAPATYQGFVKR